MRIIESIVKLECKKQGLIYVDGYVNTDIPFNTICSCGRPYSVRYHPMKKGSKCRACRDYSTDQRIGFTEEQIIAYCISRGLEYLDGYVNTDKPFNYVCSCGNKTYGWYHNLKRGYATCEKCKVNGRDKFKHEDVAVILQSYGLELVSQYKDTRTPLVYLCRCGGIGQSVFHTISPTSACPMCVENKWRSLFNHYGHEIIAYNSATEIEYLCYCGEVNTLSGSNWLNTNKDCPKCRIVWNRAVIRPGRPCLKKWKKELLIRDEFKCRNCEHPDDLQAHHIEAFYARPDLAEDIDNGIILCDVCHREIHQMYGVNVGRENLIRELG